MHIAEAMGKRETIKFLLSRFVENTKNDARPMARHDCDVDATVFDRDAERSGRAPRWNKLNVQVITVGALRPVRASMPASECDREIRSASAVCVSSPCFAASGS